MNIIGRVSFKERKSNYSYFIPTYLKISFRKVIAATHTTGAIRTIDISLIYQHIFAYYKDESGIFLIYSWRKSGFICTWNMQPWWWVVSRRLVVLEVIITKVEILEYSLWGLSPPHKVFPKNWSKSCFSSRALLNLLRMLLWWWHDCQDIVLIHQLRGF